MSIVRTFFSEMYGEELSQEACTDIVRALGEFGITLSSVISLHPTQEESPSCQDVARFWVNNHEKIKAITDKLKATYRLPDAEVACLGRACLLVNLIFLESLSKCDHREFRNHIFSHGKKGNVDATTYMFFSFAGKAEFEIGRRLQDHQTSSAYFQKACDHLSRCRETTFWASTSNAIGRRHNHGMAGCASYFLALNRQDSGQSAKHILETAKREIEAAEAEGDTTPQHFEYLGKVLVQLACTETPPDATTLELGRDALLTAVRSYGPQSPRDTITALGGAELRIGLASMYSRRLGEAASQFERAARYLEEALRMRTGRTAFADEALHGRLGQAYYGLSRVAPTLSTLENALEHLGQAVATQPQWKHYIVLLHLDRYRMTGVLGDLDMAEQCLHSMDPHQLALTQTRKLKARIDLCWAIHWREGGDPQRSKSYARRAITEFSELGTVDPDAYLYLGRAWAEFANSTSDRAESINGFRQAISVLRKPLPDSDVGDEIMTDGVTAKSALLPTLALKLSILLEEERDSDSERADLLRLACRVAKAALSVTSENNDRAKLNSIRANACLALWRLTKAPAHLSGAVEAVSASFEKPVDLHEDGIFLGVAGTIYLTAVGHALDTDETSYHNQAELLQLLSRAEACLTRSVALLNPTVGTDAYVTAHSRIGQLAFYRHILTQDSALLDQIRDAYERSIASGQAHPDVIGRLGDVYLHLHRHTGELSDLRRARELKAIARSLGGETRENWSLTVRMLQMEYAHTGDIELLLEAACFSVAAWRCDPTWPWPLCQLAECIERIPQALGSELLERLSRCSWPGCEDAGKLSEELRRSGLQSASIWLAAANLARTWADTHPDQRRRLGGASGAFALSDPYGLLNQMFVFKDSKGSRRKRRQELMRLNELRPLFQAHFPDKSVSLPSPVCVVELPDGTSSLVLRYEVGDTLAQYLSTSRTLFEISSDVAGRLLEGLAYFNSLPTVASKDHEWILEHEIARRLSVPNDVVGGDELQLLLVEVLSLLRPHLLDLPLVLKKDAHAENWLITRQHRVTLIDVESVTPRLLYHDLAQMIEGYPVFSMDEAGWRRRREWVSRYTASWNAARGYREGEASSLVRYYPIVACIEIIIDLIYCWRQILYHSGRASRSSEAPTASAAGRASFRSGFQLEKATAIANWLKAEGWEVGSNPIWLKLSATLITCDRSVRGGPPEPLGAATTA